MPPIPSPKAKINESDTDIGDKTSNKAELEINDDLVQSVSIATAQSLFGV